MVVGFIISRKKFVSSCRDWFWPTESTIFNNRLAWYVSFTIFLFLLNSSAKIGVALLGTRHLNFICHERCYRWRATVSSLIQDYFSWRPLSDVYRTCTHLCESFQTVGDLHRERSEHLPRISECCCCDLFCYSSI